MGRCEVGNNCSYRRVLGSAVGAPCRGRSRGCNRPADFGFVI
jgi:hypothetical protein